MTAKKKTNQKHKRLFKKLVSFLALILRECKLKKEAIRSNNQQLRGSQSGRNDLPLSPRLSFVPLPLHDDHAISCIMDALPCVYPRRGFSSRSPWVLLQPWENSSLGEEDGASLLAYLSTWHVSTVSSQERAGFLNVHGILTSPFCALIDYLRRSPIVTDPNVCFSFLT